VTVDKLPTAQTWWGREGLGVDMYEAARRRILLAYENYDAVIVSFSGGKDSMATFEVTYEVAAEIGALPLQLHFYDDEVVGQETVDYALRTAARPGVDMHWWCLPSKNRNACTSLSDQFWYPWDPTARNVWVREPPEIARTLASEASWYEDPADPLDRPTFVDVLNIGMMHANPGAKIASLLGLRVAESLMRRRMMTQHQGAKEAYVFPINARIDKLWPIYDWDAGDLWTAARDNDWDYNATYDRLEMLGLTPELQRVSTPFGDEPIGALHQWHEVYPEMWDRITTRIPGVLAAARYGRTELYGYGRKDELPERPPHESWPEFIRRLTTAHVDRTTRIDTARVIRDQIKHHYKLTSEPILEPAHPVSGVGWKFLLGVAMRGDMKNRHTFMPPLGNPEKYAAALADHRESRSIAARRANRAQGSTQTRRETA
jgi:predicted phosphoadenosine phosphosulfate sulfurtransferase